MSQLPPGWAEVCLGDVAKSVQNGIFVSRPGVDPDGVPILRISAVRPGRLDPSDIRYSAISLKELEASGALVAPGDLIFTRYNGNIEYVGACAIVPKDVGPLTYPDKLIRVRVDNRVVEPQYVRFAFESPQIRSQVRAAARTTSGQTGISGASLKKIRLMVPALAEQRRIVAALEDRLAYLDAAQHNVWRARARVNGLVRSLRQRAVLGGIDTETRLPDGWHWGLLRDVVDGIDAGKSFTCAPRPARSDEWGVIKVSAMTWGKFRPSENKAVPDGRAIELAHQIHEGDILISRANTAAYVGAPVIVRQCDQKLLLSDKSLRLRVKSDVNKEWLLHVLASPLVRQQISARATGTKDSMRNISQKALLNVKIPIPRAVDQGEIAAELSSQLEAVDRLKSEAVVAARRGDKLRSALLRVAFTGGLVPQDSHDEPASELIARVRDERAATSPPQKARSARSREELAASPTKVTSDDYQQEALPL
ncbi:restriction endonuclease subunit S [Micromonospora sp. NPDC094482]|uniref:restriction endonuclease subunit S n=1 Tax=unclassified Micromonospora TaxID=2617518 RepID=UPI00331886AC